MLQFFKIKNIEKENI